MTEAPATSSAPVRVPDGFEFVRLLGRGGNGYVVCARQVDLDRLVAIKMIYGGALAAGGLARLQREGRALARLDHPGVVRVYAAVPMAQDLALVLEYVDGSTLEAAIGSLDVEATFGVLDDVAEALQHCAAHGIVHRDLKPANVLLTAGGRAKVADFGISRLSQVAGAFRTSSGVISGTPAYMAPEQIREPDHEHPSADAYSFAVVAYRALTGQLPVPQGESSSPPVLTAPLDARAAAAFERAMCPDASVRLRPHELLAHLRAIPAETWSVTAREQPPRPGSSTAAIAAGDEDTARAPTAVATQPASASAGPAGVVAAPAAHRPVSLDASWVDVPVFSPGRSKRSLASSPALVGVVVGLLTVLLVAALLARG